MLIFRVKKHDVRCNLLLDTNLGMKIKIGMGRVENRVGANTELVFTLGSTRTKPKTHRRASCSAFNEKKNNVPKGMAFMFV